MKSGAATKICRNFLHFRLNQFRYDSLPQLWGYSTRR
jgi:hypothetical protein